MRISANAILVSVLLTAAPALADGIPAYHDSATGWNLLPERAQQAVIALEGGRQTMLIRVALGGDGTPAYAEKLVWILPIPAQAPTVQVRLLHSYPEFWGIDPAGYLVSKLRGMLATMASTQIFPALPIVLLSTGRKAAAPEPEDIVVYERVYRDGVELKLLGAASTAALGAHLREMGVEFPRAGLEALAPYTEPGACMVVYRIADLAAYRKVTRRSSGVSTLAVKIRFPTETGFFPLVASSALPGERIHVIVTTLGFMTAEEPVPPGLTTGHFVGEVKTPPEVQRALKNALTEGSQRYTRFVLRAAPKDLTADLRFRPGASGGTEAVAGLVTSSAFGALLWIIGLLLFAGLSIGAALAARFTWPDLYEPTTFETIILGLANFTTLLGVLVLSVIKARRLGLPTHRGIRFGLVFSGFFCLGVGGLYLLTLPFG